MGIKNSKKKKGSSKDECSTESNNHFRSIDLFRSMIIYTDMEFVKKFTPPEFQAKTFTPSISPNFNSVSGKTHKK